MIRYTYNGQRKPANTPNFDCHLYRARIKVTKLLIPTHTHFHWLKFIKNI